MKQDIEKIWEILNRHEERLKNINFSKILKNVFKRKLKAEKQKDHYLGVHLALCVDTRDPWGQGRVRYFSPILNTPIKGGEGPGSTTVESAGGQFTTRVDQLDWAWPISAMGGIDDSGLAWVPPPGSTVCILFQNANPKSAFYIGTTWHRDRGPEDDPNWNYIVPEYNKIFKGHRKIGRAHV